MDNKKSGLSVNLEYDEAQTIPLALHEMHMVRADRWLFWICICWAELGLSRSAISKRLPRIVGKVERTAEKLHLF